MSRIVTFQELIEALSIKPDPLDQEGVSGLSIVCVPNPNLASDLLSRLTSPCGIEPLHHLDARQRLVFLFLALSYTPTEGLVTRWHTLCVSGPAWEGTLPCRPSFIRSRIKGVERAGIWDQDHYHPPATEELIMSDPETYILRIKDAERGRERVICMIDPGLAPDRTVRKLGHAINSLFNLTRRGFSWRSWLHSLLSRRQFMPQ